MGNQLWELYLLEHGIGDDGVLSPSIKEANKRIYENAYDTIFNETDSGQLVPRAVFVDLEPTVTGELHTTVHIAVHNHKHHSSSSVFSD